MVRSFYTFDSPTSVKMMIAARYVYNASRDNIKEAEQKRQWRKTFDPNYVSRRSTLVGMPKKWKRQSFGRLSMMLGSRLVSENFGFFRSYVDEGRRQSVIQKPEKSHLKRLSEDLDEHEARGDSGFVKL